MSNFTQMFSSMYLYLWMSVNTVKAIPCTNIPEPYVTISRSTTTSKYVSLEWTPVKSLV